MIVYRLAKEKYKHDLSGKGAELAGGRWNSKGVALLYTSESRSLCLAEIAVHTPLGIIPRNYYLVEIEFPENEILELDIGQLPKDWQSFPHSSITQALGNKFVTENTCLVFKVPSAIVQGEFNYLINPYHPKPGEIRIVTTEIFQFDERMFK